MSPHIFHYDPPSLADDGDELSIQVRLQARLKLVAPTIRFVATPNAGKRSFGAAARAKREGMSAGFPDANIMWPGGIAFVEIKQKRGSLSPAQIDWLNWLHKAGFPCGCFRSVDRIIDFLRAAGAPIMERAA